MTGKIAFELVAPERLLLSKPVDMVTVPGTEGYMGIMAGHAPLISALRPGMVDILDDGKDTRFFIRCGFVEVTPAQVRVLAEEVTPMSGMDLAVLDQRIRDAEADEMAATTDAERTKAAQLIHDLTLVRAAF